MRNSVAVVAKTTPSPLERHHRVARHGIEPFPISDRSATMHVADEHDPVLVVELLGRLKDLLDLGRLVRDVALGPRD